MRYQVLLIAGRSGVGKSTVGCEVSTQLDAAGVSHCHVEGDNLAAVYPPPPNDPTRGRLAEANLAAIWQNNAELGYRRMVFTNTVSVLGSEWISRAMGGNPRVVGVLLTATDATANSRLAGREIGSGLQRHIERSAQTARGLEAQAPPWVIRLATDGRSVIDIARDVIAATGWIEPMVPSAAMIRPR